MKKPHPFSKLSKVAKIIISITKQKDTFKFTKIPKDEFQKRVDSDLKSEFKEYLLVLIIFQKKYKEGKRRGKFTPEQRRC